ncbi:MAG TPA: PAS domain S-box protein, partial [Bryobacteraceae bacterium]|nr:PAS domain S-box protein [Bryobacteraceae bacterium]
MKPTEAAISEQSQEARVNDGSARTSSGPDGAFAHHDDTCRQIEQELREQLDLTRTIAASAAEAIFVLNCEGRTTFANPAAEQMFGWTAEELLGQELHGLVHAHHPDGSPFPMIECPLGQVFLHGRTLKGHEDTFWHRDGHAVDVLCSNAPIMDDGQVKLAVLVVHDITERKRAEAQLRDSEVRFRTVFQSSRDAIGVAVGEQHAYVNSAYAALFGYSDPAQLPGVPILDLIAPSHREQLALLRRARLRGEHVPDRYITRGLRSDGTEFEAEMRVSSFTAEARFHTLVIVRDVTAERAAEQELRRSEERYRVFVAQSFEGVWRFESDQPIHTSWPEERQIEAFFETAWLAECNDAMARMYGYQSASELVGKRLGELLDRSDGRAQGHLQRYIQSGYRLASAESLERDRNGHPRWFVNSMIGVVENGILVRTWGTQRDITERKLAEQSTAKHADELARANADLQQFAYVTSHDLKEPLRMITSYAQLLQLRYRARLDGDADRFLTYMVQGTRRMEDLINDLLAYSRVTNAGDMPTSRVSLGAALEWALLNLRMAVEDSEAIVTHQELPMVTGSHVLLVQLFQNLLSNA